MKKEGEDEGGREEAGEGERREEGEQGGDYSAHLFSLQSKEHNTTALYHDIQLLHGQKSTTDCHKSRLHLH